MLKRIVIIVVILAALAGGMAAVRVQVTLAQDPTIPTRTPTPDPNQPTRTDPTATSTGPDNPGNPPTDTPIPGQTDTVVPGASASPTSTIQNPGAAVGSSTPGAPVGTGLSGIVAVDACDDTPYVQATKLLTVYAGPGGDYEVLAILEIDETRLILGRAGFADWWHIEVSPGLIGWVDDEDVNAYGNTALVMIVEPPAINGATPTPGPTWNPTPLPQLACAPTATPSPTSTATPSPTSNATIASGATGDQPTLAAPDAVVAEVTKDTTAEQEASTASGLGVSSRGAEAGRATSPTGVTNLVLPLAGLVMIGAGIVLALLSRNRGGSPEDKNSTNDGTDSTK